MDQIQRQKIKEVIQALVSNIGVAARIDDLDDLDEVRFVMRLNDAGALIGANGANLLALSHLVKKIVHKQVFNDEIGKDIGFSIDVNDYQKIKNDHLRETAKAHAQRVRYFKKEVLLPPMNAHDRRIVHAALTEYPDITTESTGEGINRRVVIKPYNI